MIKTQIFDENKKEIPRKYMYFNVKQHLSCELAPLTRDVTWLKL